MTHSYAAMLGAFMCAMTHAFMCHDSCIYVSRLFGITAMPQLYPYTLDVSRTRAGGASSCIAHTHTRAPTHPHTSTHTCIHTHTYIYSTSHELES